jgi:sortase (surface protein transpeptidase)
MKKLLLLFVLLASSLVLVLGVKAQDAGNALSFDGGNDYASIPDDAVFKPDTVTIEMWVLMNSTAEATILAKPNSRGPYGAYREGYEIRVTNNRFTAVMANNGNQKTAWQVNPFVTGRWYFIAAVFSRTSVSLYVNGKLEQTTLTGFPLDHGAFPVVIGMAPLFSAFAGMKFDDLRIFNRTRNAAQIEADMTSFVSVTEPGLVAYYNFDHGTPGGINTGAAFANDVTPGSRFAILYNFALNGSSSNWVSSYALTVPKLLAETNIGSTSFTANWMSPEVGTASTYQIEVSLDSTFAAVDYLFNTLSAGTSYTLSGIDAGARYYYRVEADRPGANGSGAHSQTRMVDMLPLPVIIDSIVPETSWAGGTITIYGANMRSATSVNIAGVPVRSFKPLSGTSITAVLDSSLSGKVTVVSPSGADSIGGFFFTPVPQITSAAPLVLTVTPQYITVKGKYLSSIQKIEILGLTSPFTIVSDSEITVSFIGIANPSDNRMVLTSPAGVVAKAGFTVQYTNVNGIFTIVSGKTTTLTATGAAPFTWYDDSTGGNLLHTGAVFTTPSLTNATHYWLSANNSTRKKISISVLDSANVAGVLSASATPNVSGQSDIVRLNATVPMGVVNWYLDSVGGAPFESTVSGQDLIINPTATTTYYATQSLKTDTFRFQGSGTNGIVQTWTVPAGVYNIKVEAAGSKGGGFYATGYWNFDNGGLGGLVKTDLNVTPGQVLYIYTGKEGGLYGASQRGWNGGSGRVNYGGGGGDATDIRMGGTDLSNRIVVAGGGGGGGATGSSSPCGGGSGGGLIAGSVTCGNGIYAIGGSQVAAGGNAGLGYGGLAQNSRSGGGGGSGYYGGGLNNSSGYTAGGGGSSYTDPYMCYNVEHEAGMNYGSGYVLISYYAPEPKRVPVTVRMFDLPVITSFTPTDAGAGDSIIIRGTNFQYGVRGVRLGEVPVASYTVYGDTIIKAVVGAGSTGNLRIVGAGGSTVKSGFVFIPSGNVFSYTPIRVDSAGSMVQFFGSRLGAVSEVKFGGTPASSFQVVSGAVLKAVTDTGSNGDIELKTPGGITTMEDFWYGSVPGNALSFDGGNDFVPIANPTLGGDFTIEFWMKTTQHGPGEWLDWPQGAGIVNGEVMGAVADFGTSLMGSKLGFGTGPTSSSLLRDYTIKSVSDVNTGQWTHVAVTRSKNTGLIQLYINGVLESSATAALGMLNSPPRLVLGAQQTENNFFKGSLDEVRIWTNVRTAAQIAANMRVASTGLESGLAALYNFDKGIPAGNNSRFTTVGEMSFHQLPGTLRNFTLTGTTSNFVKSYAMLQSQFYSFAPLVVLPYDTITLKGTYMNHTLDVSIGNTIVPFTILSDSELIATAPVTTGFTQRSITVRTIAGSASLQGLTVHGIELDTFSPANIIPGTVVTIKGKLLNYATGVWFGTLQAASFTILSDSVITAVVPVAGYMTADSLSVFGGGESISLHGLSFIGVPGIASFTPKNGVADTVMSITGTDFVNVTAVSVGGMPVDSFWVVSPSLIKAVLGAGSTGAVKVTTVLGSVSLDGFLYNAYSSEDLCLNFDGGDDHVRINRPVQNDFTIEYWMRTTQVGPQVTAWPGGIGIVDGEVGGVVDDYGTSLIGDHVSFGVGVPSKGTDSTLKSVTKVNTGRWVHVAATRKQATGRIELYVNGVLEDSCTTANTSQLTSPGTLVMGMIQTMNNSFKGEIDDVRFWDVVKTASEIRVYKDSIMKGTEANLVAYYDFDIGESGGNNSQFNILFNKKGTSLANSGSLYNFALNGNTSNWVKSYAHRSPDITFITPLNVPDSTPVEIHGTRFTEVNAVSSGGEPATSFTLVSDTLIVARFGNGRTGQVKVMTPMSADSVPGLLVMYTPVLGSFSPVNAGPGLTIKVGGKWFDSTTTVTVGGVAAQFTVLSTETLTVVVPMNATLNDKIIVTTLYGTAEKNGYTYYVTPTITSFTPKAIATGDTMSISGRDLATTTGITIGGVPVSYTVISDSLIKAIVSTGIRDSVVVTTYGGTALDTGFIYIYPPDIKHYSPVTAHQGDVITVTGKYFTTTTAVKVAGVDVTSFEEFSDSVIVFTVPYTVSGNVSVTALGGTSHKSGFFYGEKAGNAIKFDGQDDFISVPSSPGLTAPIITVEAWVQPNANDGFIVAKPNSRASAAFPIYIEGYQISMSGGRFRADMAGPAWYVSNRSVQSAPFTQGVWYHVAAVFTENEMSLFVNGVLQQTTQVGYALFHGTTPLNIATGPLPGAYGNCTIDELRIFSTDRSAYINSDMNTLLPQGTPGLEAYYTFDRGVPGGLNPGITSLPDMSGNNNTGILYSSALSGIASNWVRSDAMNQPEVTSFYPPAQLPGSIVTVRGRKLAELSEVSFGGVAAESFTINSDSEVVAVVAAGGATGIVTVTSAGGVGVMGGFTALIPPVIGAFTPVEAGAGITITITGTDFKDVSEVTIGGIPVASYTVVSINTITAVVNNGATSGDVTVTTNAGTAIKNGFVFYDFPVINSFTPAAASPTVSVTINGNNFTGTSSVIIGGVAVNTFVVASDSVIQVIIGNGTVIDDSIRITTPAGIAVAGGFTTLPQVAIQYFTPTNAKAGDLITIYGSKLLNASSVSFGNVPAWSFAALSDSVVIAVVDSGSSGNIDIVTPDFGKVSRNGFWYGYNAGNALNMLFGSGVTIADAPQLHEPEVTVEFWVKPLQTGSSQSLVQKGNMAIVFTGGSLYFVNYNNFQQRLISNSITTGEWYHISMVATNAFGQSVILIYLNGERNRFVLGTDLTGGTWSFGGNLACEIDEFKIYKGDRTDENWLTGVPGMGMMKSDIYGEADPSDTNLLAYYNFNIGIPGGNNAGLNSLSDLSRFHNDGVLYNFILNGNTSNWVQSTIPFGPKVNSFTPDTAYLGDTITILGKRLNSTSVVSFGGVPATSFTIVSDSMIMAVVGDVASGKVAVGSGANGDTLTSLPGFTFIPEARISSFTPVIGGEGTIITIYGKHLTGLSAVSFGGIAADSFAFVNDTMLTAVVDTGASGEVSITSAHGTATKPGFAYFAAPPGIASFEPDSAATGDTITIRGTLLTSVADVEIGGVDALHYTILSDSVIRAVVGITSSGNVSITAPFGTTSEPGFFYISKPYIVSYTPGAAAATAVTINGVNFTGTTAVSFGGVASPSFTVDSDTKITAYTGLGASGEIKVTNAFGTGTAQGFVYYKQPVVSSFTPASGATGHTITIKGTGFSGATGVNFGATASASFTILSDTVITAVVNNGSTGGINVSGPGGTGFRNGFSYINLPSDNVLPTITHSTVCNQLSVTSLNVTNVSITDANNINTTAGTKPRLYYKKTSDANVINGNTNTTQGWKYVEANGIVSPFDFTVDYSKLYGGSVTTGDTINYFIVAQDKTAVPNTAINGGSFATAPASVNLATANLPAIVSHNYFIGSITPAVTVATAQMDVCAGRTVTFTVAPTYGGSSPAYQWKKNSVNVGTGISYSSNAIADNDTMYCVMTSNYSTTCPIASLTPVSNKLVMNVGVDYTVSNPKSICNGGAYAFNGHTYTTAGTYRDTLHTTIGCDSIIVTQLTVNPLYTSNNVKNICSGTSYLFNGHTYTSNGTYRDTLHSVNGCDSIIVTQLTVNPVYSVNNPQTICSVNSYSINGHTYTTAGTYRDTLHTVPGCDSIIVTQLMVQPTFTINNPQAICNGSSYAFNGHTYSTSGTYRDTLGCTIIVTQLTVNGGNTIVNPRTICSGGAYTINGHTYSSAGVYHDTLQTALGCDSFVVTQLTVNPVYTANTSYTICSGGSYLFNGHTYTIPGTYYDTLHAVTGCDSIVITQLNVNPVYSVNNPQTICSGTSYSFNGHTYTIAASYRDTLHAVNGCDSIIITQLSVNPVYSRNNPQTICSGISYSFNGHTYSTAGNYRDTLHTTSGCDSIIVTQLTVNPIYSVNNPQTICNGSSYTFNSHTYTLQANYRDTLHTVNGCDSIVVTQLTVNPVYSVNNPQTICNGGSYIFNGHTYTLQANYRDTLHTVNGCDSIIVTQLTVNPVYSVNNPRAICNGGSYTFNGRTYTTAASYRDTLHTINGCDSIIVTQLTVNPVYSVNNPQTICNGGSYTFNGHTYTTAASYRDTLHTINGCDSIIVTQLTVNPVYSVNNPQTICSGGSYIFNGHTYSTAASYRDTLHSITGCDSIIVTQLTVNPVYSVNNPRTICAGGSYTFNSHTYTVAGTYRDTLHTVTNCDSIIITQLMVNPVYTVNNPQTICNVSSYTFNGHTYTTAGTYRDTLHAVTGCDSVIVTQLTVSPTFTINNPQTICSGSSYTFNGHTYSSAGTYRDTIGCTIIVSQVALSGGTTFTNPQTICNGKSYAINGHSYIISGTYHDTLHTAYGCDSFVVTQLTVNPVFTSNNPQTICGGSVYTLNGHAYANAGIYHDTLHAVSGCDSIIVTALTVNPVYSVNNPQVICTGSSYAFNGHTYTTAASYRDTLHSVNGCDSIIITQLTVNPVYSVSNLQTICSGSSYTFNGHTYTIAATYRDTLHTVAGCDSIIVTLLTINPVYAINNPQTICAGSSYSFNGHIYTTAASYRDTLHAVTGCDSIIVTQLTVNPVYSVNNPQTICNGGSYSFNGHTYTTAASYRDTLHSVTGCDSIIVTQLTVNPVYSVNNPQAICNGSSYTFNGHTYTTAASYRDTLHSVTGCDSIIVTQLTVNPVYSVNNPQAICNGSSYIFNGHTYTIAATYKDTLHTATGCDSIIVTQLTVKPVYSVNNLQTICSGGSYSFNGHTYTTAASYRDTLHSVTGCDSIIVTQLTVNPVYSVNNPQTICSGSSYTFNSHTYTASGSYNDTLHTVNGCDSIIVTQLTVNPVYSVINSQTICSGNSYTFNSHTYTANGSYNDTLHTVNGCDSIIITQLIVNPVYSVNNPQMICSGSSYLFNSHTYTASGNYNDTLHSVNGCDSIVITQLTVNPVYAVNNPQAICSGNSYTINGHMYTIAGNYNDTLHTINGCDSIITTQLTVNPKPTATVTTTGLTQFCQGGSALLDAGTTPGLNYQWLNNNLPVAAATNAAYGALTSGNYRVRVTDANSCADTSAAVAVTVNPKPATSSITGEAAPEVNTIHAYSVSGSAGSTYNWIITGGTKISGGNSSLIVIQWGNMAGNAFVKVIETNVTGCVGDTISQMTDISLPVKLISFKAKRQNENVKLEWTTASELNNDYFTIQRSTDGKHFEPIANVKGNGTTNTVTNYLYLDKISSFTPDSYRDDHSPFTTLYYRLIQTDYDGTSTASQIISVDLDKLSATMEVSAQPNPFTDQATLIVKSPVEAQATLRITDGNGKIAEEQTVELYKGETQIDLTRFANANRSGVYTVQVISGTEVTTCRIMKAK